MEEKEISKATIARMPLYLHFLQEEASKGAKYISSTVIAQNTSVSSVLVRKDRYLECECLCEGLHEDFVCWLRMLRSGTMVRGIDEPLLIYRLSANSKSGNKLKAAKMNWRAYRAAGLNVPAAAYYMGFYAVNSLLKYRNLK